MRLQFKASFDELLAAGDYTIADDGKARRVIMACPVCTGLFVCPHEIIQENPLTLSPSIVGPDETYRVPTNVPITEQVLSPCGHHFFVKDGEVVDAM